jgi:hypothetical protein
MWFAKPRQSPLAVAIDGFSGGENAENPEDAIRLLQCESLATGAAVL